jgi:folylpolyglutamate synthase
VIMEVGMGGEYDATNIIPMPTCVGVTSLGMDHLEHLGTTLESIAWHKGGIFKSNIAAFTVEQPPGAMKVLRERAKEKNVNYPC